MAALDITHTTPPPAEWVRVGDLHPWDRNPKAHPAETVAEIARSIVRFGFTEPLIVWRSQKRVVAGHGPVVSPTPQPKPRADQWYSRPKYADPVLWRRAMEEVAEAAGEPVPDMGEM